MLGDVGLENLPGAEPSSRSSSSAATLITGLNLNFLKLLPKLKTLSLNGIQRRNAGACWTPRITDLDLDTISLLSGLEELDLGVGIEPRDGRETGGARRRQLQGHRRTADYRSRARQAGEAEEPEAAQRERRAAHAGRTQGAAAACRSSGSACGTCADARRHGGRRCLPEIPTLANLDLSYTPVSDQALQQLATLPNLKQLYLTETKVTPEAVAAFQKQHPNTFVSWARRPRRVAHRSREQKPESRRCNEVSRRGPLGSR